MKYINKDMSVMFTLDVLEPKHTKSLYGCVKEIEFYTLNTFNKKYDTFNFNDDIITRVDDYLTTTYVRNEKEYEVSYEIEKYKLGLVSYNEQQRQIIMTFNAQVSIGFSNMLAMQEYNDLLTSDENGLD